MDVRTADLFTARLEGAEKFLVGAWTCCQLRQKCGIALPFTSIEKLLEQDSTKLLQLWPAPAPAAGPGVQQHQGGTMIKLNFSNLLSLHHNSPHPPPAPAPQQQPQQLGRGTANGTGGSSSSGGDVLGKAGAAEATVGKLHSNGGSEEAAMGSLQAMNINGQQQQQQQQPRGQGGLQGSTWADEADEEHGAYGDAGGEYGNGYEHDEYGEYAEDHEDGDEAAGGEVGQAAGGRASGLPGAHSGGANASGAAAGADGRAAGPNGGRMRLPLRPDLMKSYLWAVFGADGGGGPGGAKDVLAALAAAALVHAGRGRQPPSYNSPAAGALRDRMHAEAQERRQATDGGLPMWNFDPLCFSMPLAKLAAHLQATAPKALPPAGGAVGAVSQALRDPRHGRGCFRFMALPAADGGGGGTVEDVLGPDEEEVVVLDLGLLRERVVEALTVAAKATFQPISGHMPDMLRYLTTVHLASLTQSFAGWAHCVRLASLARHLAEAAPDAGCHEFDPSRLDGLARILTTTPGPVLFTMDRPMPGSGKPVRLVSLNVGKLIETAERNGWVPGGGRAAAAAASRAPPAVPAPPAPAQEAAVRLSVAELWSGGGADATVKRQAALRLLAALYTQPGGLLPLVRLHDALCESLSQTVAAQAGLQQVQQLERLLRTEPEVFELQTQWSGGPLGARLRVGSLLAKAEAAKASQAEQRRSAAVGHGGSLGSAAYHNPHQHQSPAVPSKPAYNATGAPALQQQQQPHPYPLRPDHAPCPYYVRNGTCGYGNACKYDHPVHLAAGRAATPQAESAATAAAAAAAAAAAVAAASAAAATVAPRSAPQAPPPPPQQPHNQHQPPAPPRASSSSGSGFYPPSATTPPSTPIPTTAPASSLSPTSLEVHVITTACTPDHLDMLQHCYAAGQVSLCCKHQQLTHTHTLAAAEAGAPVLVQLYVPAVTSGGGAGGSSSSNSSKAGGAGGAPGGGGGGGAGGGGGNGGGGGREWPATVYLVDPAGAGDRGALLLGSLCALLEDAAVTKVVYCGKEVVPSLARGCHARLAPMRDVTVLHAMTEAMAAAVAGGSIGGGMGGGGSTPLATLLQAHGLLTAAAVPALTAAPVTSRLWSERPLGATLRQQAVLEVAHLPALWAALMARLNSLPQQLSQATGDALAAQARGLQDGARQQQQQQAARPQVQQIALPQQHQHQHQPQQAPVSHGLTRPGQQHQHPHQHKQQQASYGSGGGSSAGTSHYSTSAAGAGGGGSMRYGAAGGTLAGGGGGGGGPLARPSVGQPGVGLGSGMGGSMSMGSGDVRRAAPSRGPSRY